MHPTLDRVLLKDISSVVTETEGGIIIPESALDSQRYRQWEIAAVGPDVQEPTLLPGLEVITSGRFVGEPVHYQGETYRVVSERDVIAIIIMEE